jgi:hypothetical protein
LLDADELCQREVARRLFGDLRNLTSSQAQRDGQLDGVDVVAMMGNEINGALLDRCLNNSQRVFLAATACRGELWERLITQHLTTTERLLHIGNPIASLPSRQLIQQQTEQGKLGDPGLIRTHRWYSETESPQDNHGYIPLLLLCEIDQVLRYFRASPTSVYATTYANKRGMLIHLKWACGAMAIIDYTSSLPVEQSYASFSVIGSRGSAYADDHQNAQMLVCDRTLGLVASEVISPTAHMLTSFLASLIQPVLETAKTTSIPTQVQPQPHATLMNWYRAQLLAKCVRQSLEERTCVPYPADSYILS